MTPSSPSSEQRDHLNTATTPDALSPEALREEMVNIVLPSLGSAGNRIARMKAEHVVDEILVKLMTYYSAVATPEVVSSAPQTFAVIQRLTHAAEQALTAGSACAQAWSSNTPQRGGWQRAALNLRNAMKELLECLT